MSSRPSTELDIELSPVTQRFQSGEHLIGHSSAEDAKGCKADPAPHDKVKRLKIRIFDDSKALFKGWKFTAFLAFISSLVVLIFNLAFVIYVATRDQNGKSKVLLDSDCRRVQRVSTVAHWVINMLSTILLSASNFGMQCLAAPTRKYVDKAHRKARYLDIGVPSIRNLFHVSFKRSLPWLCLVLSSLPLHIFFNSTVFSTSSVSSYDVFTGPGFSTYLNWSWVGENIAETPSTAKSLELLFNASKENNLRHLKGPDCVEAFAHSYQTSFGGLLLVPFEGNETFLYEHLTTNPVYRGSATDGKMAPYPWMCPQDKGSQSVCGQVGTSAIHDWAENQNWTVGPDSLNVNYCLAEPIQQHCKLQSSVPMTLVVFCFNLVKTIVLLYVWIGISDAPILTVGDAVASFLYRQDSHSQHMCLVPGTSISKMRTVMPGILNNGRYRRPLLYKKRRRRWGSAVYARWGIFILIWISALVAASILLAMGTPSSVPEGSIWKVELGAMIPQTILSGDGSNDIVIYSLVSNLPQLLTSVLYFLFNNILTTMCLAAEWSRFGNNRKGLRVSHNPKGAQRSNYFLSIPYRYALPLILASAILHWLISEGFFMVMLETYDSNRQREPGGDVYGYGFSAVAILGGILVASVMFICLIGLGFRGLHSAIPLAGSCSLAIAAACHPRLDSNSDKLGTTAIESLESENGVENMALLPVQWGSIPQSGPIGHCSFTSEDVSQPDPLQKYE